MTSKPFLIESILFFLKVFVFLHHIKKFDMENTKEMAFMIDKWEDGTFEMHRHGRTYVNKKCGDTKDKILGKLVELISNELDNMKNYESLNITFWKH